jgi:hypothetical protein
MEVAEMLSILRADDLPHPHTPLYTLLDGIDGVDDTDYDGFFGPFLFYKVSADCDCEETHEHIIQMTKEYIHTKSNGL